MNGLLSSPVAPRLRRKSRLRHPWSPVGFTSGAVCSLAVWADGMIVRSANELLGGSTGSAAGTRAATGQGEFPSAVDQIGMRQDDSTSGNSSGRGDVIANWESCATPVASVTTKKRKDPLTTEPRRVLGDVGNHGIAGEGSSPTQKKARRISDPFQLTTHASDDVDDDDDTDLSSSTFSDSPPSTSSVTPIDDLEMDAYAGMGELPSGDTDTSQPFTSSDNRHAQQYAAPPNDWNSNSDYDPRLVEIEKAKRKAYAKMKEIPTIDNRKVHATIL